MMESSALRTSEEFGVDVESSPIKPSDSTKSLSKKKKKVGKKKSLIAPVEPQ